MEKYQSLSDNYNFITLDVETSGALALGAKIWKAIWEKFSTVYLLQCIFMFNKFNVLGGLFEFLNVSMKKSNQQTYTLILFLFKG